MSKKVAITGINCAAPHYVNGLIHKIKKLTDKMIIAYPNSGEIYDAKAKIWVPPQCSKDNEFGSLALTWRDSGAKLIGGCC
ncbi:Homocysteine S-methyltransferase 1, partial [Bienertia sinuspersici]